MRLLRFCGSEFELREIVRVFFTLLLCTLLLYEYYLGEVMRNEIMLVYFDIVIG